MKFSREASREGSLRFTTVIFTEKDHHFERNDRNIENFEIYHFVCSFQTNNSKLLEAWIEKLNKIDWRPTKTSVLCSKHFE